MLTLCSGLYTESDLNYLINVIEKRRRPPVTVIQFVLSVTVDVLAKMWSA